MGNPFGKSIKAKVVRFHLRDVAAALIRAADIHEGLWQVQVMFGHSAVNLNLNGHLTPSAIASVVGLQVARVEQADELTVDAAQINPSSRIVLPQGAGVN